MRHRYIILPLLFPLYAFSQTEPPADSLIVYKPPVHKYTVVRSYSNELEEQANKQLRERSVDYPTQVIRLTNSMENQQLSCKQVNKVIDDTLLKNITPDKFLFNMYSVCTYDPATQLATEVTIHSYFDPLDDQAIAFLNSFLAEYNGREFLGNKLNIESAKGLILSLNISAGTKKNPTSPPFIIFRQDRANYYFKNNYEMKQKLVTDIYSNFFSNDPEKILPFLSRWFFASAENIYERILTDSNYVELQPERIFIMENGNEIFVSHLKYYFAHNCTQYENHRCLQGS